MSLIILYHNPAQPDENNMTMISSQATVAAIVDRLETSGFVVDKITQRSLPIRAVVAAVIRPIGRLGDTPT